MKFFGLDAENNMMVIIGVNLCARCSIVAKAFLNGEGELST